MILRVTKITNDFGQLLLGTANKSPVERISMTAEKTDMQMLYKCFSIFILPPYHMLFIDGASGREFHFKQS